MSSGSQPAAPTAHLNSARNFDRSSTNIDSYGYDVHEVHTSGQLASFFNSLKNWYFPSISSYEFLARMKSNQPHVKSWSDNGLGSVEKREAPAATTVKLRQYKPLSAWPVVALKRRSSSCSCGQSVASSSQPMASEKVRIVGEYWQ